MIEEDLIRQWRRLPTADEVYNTSEYKTFSNNIQFRRGQVYGYQQALLKCAAELKQVIEDPKKKWRMRRGR